MKLRRRKFRVIPFSNVYGETVHSVMATEFENEAVIRGYHVFCAVWFPTLGELLSAEREPGNSENRFAVRLRKDGKTVGHVPREISKLCRLFIRRGSITAEITSTSKIATAYSSKRPGNTLCSEIRETTNYFQEAT